ncbi:AraC family ligand binding domain-containing protein [uncultured Serinicoccus sp.]|uniref:cupin domain-containing protein n=1 Tax=uncultured Serinicoccus sp. TaxID=735514 RepID=UPI00261BC28A|nr:AraC family ligand binding domain-containing protein [uncultured Serinicoccus sp.]
MPTMLRPVRVPGTGEKLIQELAGAASTSQDTVSVARMTAPAGWDEPGQRPEFDEVTYLLAGHLVVEHEGGRLELGPGECVLTRAGEWVRYSVGPGGAEYLAVCAPAFTLGRANRDG